MDTINKTIIAIVNEPSGPESSGLASLEAQACHAAAASASSAAWPLAEAGAAKTPVGFNYR